MNKNIKRVISAFSALLLTFSLASCGEDNVSDNAETSASVNSTVEGSSDVVGEDSDIEANEGEMSAEVKTDFSDVVSCKIEDDIFDNYTSNTYLSTGNNSVVRTSDNTTYRAYIPIEEYGELEYCFYFSNTVDSTYSKGAPVYVGREGEEYEIVSACVYDGGTDPDSEPVNPVEITFDGSAGKIVAPAEIFSSDPVMIDIPEGHYLVWEWTLTGKNIPALSMADLSKSVAKEDGEDEEFGYASDIPLPVFIGAKRDKVDNRVIAIGDSITQGCQTEYMKFEFWAANIAKDLDESCSFWNCGLGWARASDASTCGSWLGRSLNCDTAIIAFGTNDITSGKYGGDGKGDSAEELLGYIEVLLNQFGAADVQNVIVFNAPPQDYREKKEAVRTEYNEALKELCARYGAYYFDFASYLCDPETPEAAKYGGHPNGEAGRIVADAFEEQYGEMIAFR